MKGKAARDFEKYQKRPGTKTEIEYFRNAEKFYLEHAVKETETEFSRILRK